MNDKIKASLFAVFVDLLLIIVGAVAGYNICSSIRSGEIAKLTAKYNETKRERDETVAGIAEDNQRLRDGFARAQLELDDATERTARLEEYIRSAGIGNQQIITDLNGAGQNLEEASRIVGGYLGE